MVELSESKLVQGQICFMGALSQLLINYGVKINEEVLYGLGFGLDFRYQDSGINGNINMDCVDLVTDLDKYRTFFKSIGIDVEFYKYSSYDKFIKCLDNSIGHSFLVAVDSFFLTYSNTYKVSHDAHVVVITKVNSEEFVIQDNYVSAIIPGKRMITVNSDVIRNACNIKAIKGIDEYLLWSLNIKQSQYSFSKQYISERLLLLDKINNHSVRENGKIFCGKEAFKRLLKTFNKYKAEDFMCKDTLISLNTKISANGGLYQTRKLYGYFINWFGNNYLDNQDDIRVAKKISVKFEEIANNWKIISTILLKSAILQRLPNWGDIISRTTNNVEMERKYYSTFIERFFQ